jgi:hypothetical protein
VVDLRVERVVPTASVEIEISAPDRGYAGILAELGRSNAAPYKMSALVALLYTDLPS